MPRRPQRSGKAGGTAKPSGPPLWVLLALVVIVLGSAIALLSTAHTRQQVVASYVLFSLVVAVITFGILQSTGTVRRKDLQLGGAIVGFVVVLWILLRVPNGEMLEVAGDLYIDGIPPQTARICLLETDLADNCRSLEAGNKGHFVIRGVRAGQDSVRLEVTLPGPLVPKVVVRRFTAGQAIRLDLRAADFPVRDASAIIDTTSAALRACRSDLAAESELFYVFDLASSNLDAERCNAFLNVLTYKLERGIREHLASYQLLADIPVQVKRCTQVRVRQKAEAEAAGRALGAPGVLWGYAEENSGQVESVLSFTALAGRAQTVFSGVSSTSSLAELARVEQPVDGLFLALVSYLLGERYRSEGKIDLARRCLLHAKELDVLSGDIEEDLDRALEGLGGASPARSLEPIG